MSSSAKKISQTELRKFMNAHKRKAVDSVKKVESPLAKYLEGGVLTCIVCNSVVKSEALWSEHINSKNHRDNLARRNPVPAPKNTEKDFPVVKKKNLPPVLLNKTPAKGILKNATPLPPKFFDSIKTNEDHDIPEKKIKLNEADEESKSDSEEPMETEVPKDTELPEGFFDDPVLDAKARNVEYKDPVEEEWERFQKEIKEETDLSAKLIHEDTEDATVERHIEEIDEQISKLSRVVQLEIKKEEVKANLLVKSEVKKEEPSIDDSDDSDIEVEFDWRAKSYLS